MKNDERRSHRLNYLLRIYLKHGVENEIFTKAKLMGVSDATAKDYMRTIIVQASRKRP